MKVSKIDLTPEEAKAVLADERLVIAAKSEIEEMHAELTRLREDKARLDYMESHCSVMRLEPEAFGFNDVRGRVDAAMEKEATNG